MLKTFSKKPGSCAVIPCFNEVHTVAKVVSETLSTVEYIIVIDDASTDDSSGEILSDERVILLRNDINQGKGYSLRKGFEKAISLNFSSVITLDADLQHPPEYIPVMFQELEKYDFVLGCRKRSGTSMPVHRRLSNYLTTKLLKVKTGVEFRDSQSGFRAFRGDLLRKILPESSGFEAETEMLIKAAGEKARFGFVEIPTIYNDNESKISPAKAIAGFIRQILK